jgi:hypothetical protein
MNNISLEVLRHVTNDGRDAPFRYLDPKVLVHAVLRAELHGAGELPLQLNANGETLEKALADMAAAIAAAQQQHIPSGEELLSRAGASARYAQLFIANDELTAGAQQAGRATALCELVRALRAGEQLYSVQVDEYAGAAEAMAA